MAYVHLPYPVVSYGLTLSDHPIFSFAPFSWIARRLYLGSLNTLRSNARRRQRLNPALA
jgi:hypothetical protein